MTSAFDYMSPSKLGSPNKKSSKRGSAKKSSVIKKVRYKSSSPKKSATKKSAPKKSATKKSAPKKSAPKSANKTPRTRSTARSTTRSTARTPSRSYRRRTGAKKHGTLRSYLKGKDMKSKLSPIVESPDNTMSPESKRLRRLGFYTKDGKLPRTPRMNKSARKKVWDDIAGERRRR